MWLGRYSGLPTGRVYTKGPDGGVWSMRCWTYPIGTTYVPNYPYSTSAGSMWTLLCLPTVHTAYYMYVYVYVYEIGIVQYSISMALPSCDVCRGMRDKQAYIYVCRY